MLASRELILQCCWSSVEFYIFSVLIWVEGIRLPNVSSSLDHLDIWQVPH